jgi:hypothetical protein
LEWVPGVEPRIDPCFIVRAELRIELGGSPGFLLEGEKRNTVLDLMEVQRYGIESWGDPDYVCIYGLRPTDWYGRGIRILGRTAVECTVRMPAHGPFPRLDAVGQPRTQNRIKLKSNSIFHPSEVKMSHSSMLKARRQHQKTRKLLDVAAKQAKRLAKLALAGPAVKKEKVKKEKVKKEKVKLTNEELGRQDAAKKSSAGAGKKGAS